MDAYFLTWNPISSEKQPIYQLFLNVFRYFLSFPEKKGSFSGGGKNRYPPSGPCTALSTSTRLVQAFGQCFSIIFTLGTTL